MSSRSWATPHFAVSRSGCLAPGMRGRPRSRLESSSAEELVPLLHQVVIFVRPLVPVGDVSGAGCERAAVAQIALFYSALRSADPRLALVPERVFFGRHGFLDVSRGRVIALLRNDHARRAGQPIIGVGGDRILVGRSGDFGDADRPGAVTLLRNRISAWGALRLHRHYGGLPGVRDQHLA